MIARTHKWYKQMKDNPIKNIVYASCILPFLDVQQAGFEMMLALAAQPWGQEEINKLPCKFILISNVRLYIFLYILRIYNKCILILALLDVVFKVSSTDSMVIKDLKKQIIKTLLESDTSKDVFNEDILSRIQHNINVQSEKNLNQSDEVLLEEMAM